MGRAKKPIPAEAPATALAQYLRELRHRAGLTYQQMAALLVDEFGCSVATLSRTDSGATIPVGRTVELYVRACGGKAAEVNRARDLWQVALQNERIQVKNPDFKVRSRRLRPITNPDFIREPLQLIDALVHLRDRAGRPPFRRMVTEARNAGCFVSRSTLSDVFAGRRMPSRSTVRAVALLYDERHPAAAWEKAWYRINRPEWE